MRLESLNLPEQVVQNAATVVAVDASDLPEPGQGFDSFFERLTQSGSAPKSQAAFDDGVVRAYSQGPTG